MTLPTRKSPPPSRHFEAWTVQPHPTAPGRSLTHIRLLVSPDFLDAEAQQAYVDENWQLFMKVAYEEDWGVARRAQRGTAGGSLLATVVGRNEVAVHFIAERVGDGSADEHHRRHHRQRNLAVAGEVTPCSPSPARR